MKVLAFGEILWDIIEGEKYLGGAPLNFAAHLVQCSSQASILSRLGNDELGKLAYDEVNRLGVNTDLVQWDGDNPTGTVHVKLANGQPDYTIEKNVAYDFIATSKAIDDIRNAGSFDALYYGSLAQRNAVSSKTLVEIISQFQFTHVFYDVNLRKDCYSKSIIHNSLQPCTILKLNDNEVPVVSKLLFDMELNIEEFCTKVSVHYELTIVIVTAGDKGCYIYTNNLLTHLEGKSVQVADTVGAGDSFSAAFLHCYGKRNSPIEAAKMANQIGAFVASNHGPIPTYTSTIRSLLLA